MSIVATIIGFTVIIVLVYFFMGILSFLPYLVGVIRGVIFFPIEIINQVIYPVGFLPYYVWTGGISLIVILIVFGLVFSKTK